MSFEVPIGTADDDECRIEMFKSWKSFASYFEDAQRMRVVTYCDSPTFILSMFDELDELDELEVVVGDVDDYRERLIDQPETADRLEQLRNEDKLTIYLCETKEVHSKLYIIDHDDNTSTCIIGSANLSKNAWTRQSNAGAIFETSPGTEVYEGFEDLYLEHRDYNNNGPFLSDLTERLETTDEPRDQVINLYTEGKVGSKDELGEIHGKLSDHINTEAETINIVLDEDESEPPETPSLDDAPDTKINLSMRGYEDATIDAISKLTDYDATVSDSMLTTTPGAFHRYTQDQFEVPPMEINDDNNLTLGINGHVYNLNQPLPDDPERVNRALENFEVYFETVDRYGNSNNPIAVKAHMMEAMLWYFWAPFVNRQAEYYRSHGINLDKALPYLYIYGESNGGKGTFAEYALSLVSGNRVESPVDADEIGKRRIRGMRSANNSFPLIVDDITKQKVGSLDTLRNYWSNWTGQTPFPMFAFISNDKRPDDWFRNRAKILNFDVNFNTSHKGEAEVRKLIEKPNPLFQWFAHEYLNCSLTLGEDADALREVRTVMLDIYEYANRDVPEYFPREPAEQVHDTGLARWHDLLSRDDVEVTEKGSSLIVTFPPSMEVETWTYRKDPPITVRVEKRGRDLVIKTPDEFNEWLGDSNNSLNTDTLVSRLRGLVPA